MVSLANAGWKADTEWLEEQTGYELEASGTGDPTGRREDSIGNRLQKLAQTGDEEFEAFNRDFPQAGRILRGPGSGRYPKGSGRQEVREFQGWHHKRTTRRARYYRPDLCRCGGARSKASRVFSEQPRGKGVHETRIFKADTHSSGKHVGPSLDRPIR